MRTDIATWLYVPGGRVAELLAKAMGAADGIVIDLEDAVHPTERSAVRELLPAALDSLTARRASAIPRSVVPIVVRVNAVGTTDFAADVAAVGPLLRDGHIDGIRLPKVEYAAQVEKAYAATSRFDDRPHLIPLIESALGLRNAHAIAEATGVHSITMGESDLRADLGLPRQGGDEGLLLARLTVVQAARASGLPSPVASVHPNVSDLEGLRTSSESLRQLGFYGRSVIHPRQIPVVREAFAPSPDELDWATAVLDKAHSMDAAGSAAGTLKDGSFIDPAILRQAVRIRERAKA